MMEVRPKTRQMRRPLHHDDEKLKHPDEVNLDTERTPLIDGKGDKNNTADVELDDVPCAQNDLMNLRSKSVSRTPDTLAGRYDVSDNSDYRRDIMMMSETVRDDLHQAVHSMHQTVAGALQEMTFSMRGLMEAMAQQNNAQNRPQNFDRDPNDMDSTHNNFGSVTRHRRRYPTGQNQTRSRVHSSSSSSGDDEGHNNDENSTTSTALRRTLSQNTSGPRLPAFSGKDWNIWFNRFTDVANIRGWTDDEKLDQLLPKLQGDAGEFVFGQLSTDVRSDYKRLIKELELRFKKIETCKSFGVKFSRRNQKAGETFEDYGAELKRLYDKAHPGRDNLTRQEDLLRKFLDGLHDDRVRAQVEYVKDPSDIDQAIVDAINFVETKQYRSDASDDRRSRVRITRGNDTSDDEDDTGRAARVSTRPRQANKPTTDATVTKTDDNPVKADARTECENQIYQSLVEMMKSLSDRVTQDSKKFVPRRNFGPNQKKFPDRTRSYECFRCGKTGHYAKQCQTVITGKLQVVSQPGTDVPTNGSPNGESAHPNQ